MRSVGPWRPPSGEETLDTEWASAMAPNAHVRVYAATDLADADLDQTYEAVYDDAINHPEYGIHQMTMSYGEGEQDTSLSQVLTDDQYFTELAAVGVTCFASTGDGASTTRYFRWRKWTASGRIARDRPLCDGRRGNHPHSQRQQHCYE